VNRCRHCAGQTYFVLGEPETDEQLGVIPAGLAEALDGSAAKGRLQ